MREGESIRSIAAANHGVIDRASVVKLGRTDHFIQRMVASGLWDAIHPGVYYLNVTPATWKASVLAGVLAAGEEAVASHRTSGTLYGLDGVVGRTVEVTVPYDDRPVPKGVLLHRSRRTTEATVIHSIPTTTIERTLLDLARFLPDAFLEKAMASALRMSLTDLASLDHAIRDLGGRGVGGTRRFRRVVSLLADEGATGSASEVEFAQLIRGNLRIPRPVTQLKLDLPNGGNAYPDFAWPHQMKLVEVDGFGTHSTPDQHQSDLHRQNMLLEMGWQIRRFSARQIRRDPTGVVDEIEQFLAA